ncbi:MAG: lamin tail domain-containing protein [Candidatus Pacebacteria bacterium]|nr:lamin tail domain-containing protein [Candidatus Paceibacterota bacterium]
MRPVLVGLFCCIPVLAEAAVTISEVAWMGSVTSANHEWIELYNSGGVTDVTGWTLSDGMNLTIALTGTIEGGAYTVLERNRSDGGTVGAVLLNYSGALVNTGATLTLKRSDGAIEDQVSGGENWQGIGGDNVTKETAQYTSTGWVTGTPTPGNANAGSLPVKEDAEEENTETVEEPKESIVSPRSGGTDETVRLVLTDAMLALKIDAQKKGYVNQPIEFEALPSGVGKTITDSLVCRWNFGDGGVLFGSNPTHTFAYPGTYVVTVYAAYKRQEQLARHEITILPVSLSVTKNVYGDVQINNDSPYEIDVSGYVVKGEKNFHFPEYSIILPNQTVTLKQSNVGQGFIQVLDNEGTIVAISTTDGISDSPVVHSLSDTLMLSPVVHANTPTTPLVLAPAAFTLKAPLPQVAGTSTSVVKDTLILEAPKVSTTTQSKVPPNAWPYLGLIIVILLGLVGTATKISRNQSE